jgi:hypothetical protein
MAPAKTSADPPAMKSDFIIASSDACQYWRNVL